jgi:hypothetical protein
MSTDTPLNASDADFVNMPEPEEETTTEIEESSTETEAKDEITSEDIVEETKAEDTSEETDTTEEIEADTKDSTQEESTEETDSLAATDETSEDTTEETTEEDSSTETDTSTIDYKAEYEKLLTPFRANGKNMQVNSVDDAITLMKMGANYNKKMAALKPNLRLMKMLQNNELLDEEKLSYLIDLDKKNPDAVQKFVKESGIDPLDIDDKKDTEYTPSTYTVNDTEVELDGVLDEIRDTDSFTRTIDIIGNKWDASSKKVLIETPAIIRVINEQVSNGIFDKITGVIESERMLGRLQGLSDLEAYKQVGQAIQAKRGFDTPVNETSDTTEDATTTSNKTQDDPKLKSRKRAASSTRSAPGSTKKDNDYNPLALSDAEFEKVASNDFI